MRKLCLFAGCAVLAAATSACLAASPWDGTWKLNEAKSKLTGTTFSVQKNGNMYTMNDGAITYKFACDGKDYPMFDKYSMACTENGLKATTTTKVDGKARSTTQHEISSDGKTMTDVTNGTRPDGTSYTDKNTYVRVAGTGTGLAGTWKNTKTSNSAPESMVLKVNGDTLHFENPGFKSSGDAKLDGTPAPIKGPTVPGGVMYWNKPDGANKVLTVVSLNGKEISRDIMTVSADGKTITDVSWTSGKENEKQTFVYDKQ